MKYFILIIIIISVFSSCSKKETPKPPEDVIDTTLGNITFRINGKSANDFHISGKKFNNKIILTGEKMELDLDMCFNNNSLKKQQLFKLHSSGSGDVRFSDSTKAWTTFATSEDEGDALCEFFEINDADSINNWVQVTKQQNNFGEIWGNFSVSCNKTQNCSNRIFPDTVVIRNGYFHVFIK